MSNFGCTNLKKIWSNKNGSLQESKVKQRIKEETMTTEIIERMKLIDVSEQEVARKACELEAKIKRPAEAEKHRCQVLAEAAKSKTLSEASGAAEGIALKGDAEAEAIEIKAKVAFTYDVRCFGSFLTYLPTQIRYHQMWLDLPAYPKI